MGNRPQEVDQNGIELGARHEGAQALSHTRDDPFADQEDQQGNQQIRAPLDDVGLQHVEVMGDKIFFGLYLRLL